MNELATNHVTYGPPRWMISFADLMSVILTFFVLLFSMSSPPKSSEELDNKLKGNSEAPYSAQSDNLKSKIKTARTDQDLSTNYLADVIENRVATYPELANSRITAGDDRLTISIAAAEFNDKFAANIAEILTSLNNRSAIYSENLDQSHAVVEKLQQSGLERNIAYFEGHDMQGKIDIVVAEYGR